LLQWRPSVAARRATNRGEDFPTVFDRIAANVGIVIRGKEPQIRRSLVCLLAEGHLLIEDVPGVGKTLLAKSIARSIGCTWHRIQFTPDLLPTDVTGAAVFNQERRVFEFKPGPIFANVVLADEINRASPKTQSSLLEAMEEQQVTIDGVAHSLASPFLVIATQNPIEHEGTYPLPFAQLDRFLMRIGLGYPEANDEIDILHTHGQHSPLDDIPAVADARTITAMISAARQVHVAESLHAYITDLVRATRNTPELSLGASPRAALALLRCARVEAAATGRDYVIPDDIKDLAPNVLAHRLLAAPEAEMAGRSVPDVLHDLIESVPVPIRSTREARQQRG
jgi:MoxR-like ATPase